VQERKVRGKGGLPFTNSSLDLPYQGAAMTRRLAQTIPVLNPNAKP
jgi:hypothetical protein